MFKGITSIIYKESIHILRDPRTLMVMLMVPGIQIILFGYAIDLDVQDVPTILYNLDGRPASRELVDAFVNTGYFKIVGTAMSDEEVKRAIVGGDAKVALKIPPGYSDRILHGEPAQVLILIDGSDSTVATQALNVSNSIALNHSLEIIRKSTGRKIEMPVDVRPRVLFNPQMETPRFMVPGLVGIVMQIVTMFLTAFAIVREKENGTLEQLMATPVSRLGLMCGKLIPYAFVGGFETGVVLLIMYFLFKVPVAGSVLLLAVCSLIFLFTALGLGLIVSTFAKTQIEALQTAYIIMLPSILLSGFIFPRENMPWIIYVLGQFIPVTYFIEILRGVILRGAGIAQLWPNAVALIVFGLILLAISTWRFRKTVA